MLKPRSVTSLNESLGSTEKNFEHTENLLNTKVKEKDIVTSCNFEPNPDLGGGDGSMIPVGSIKVFIILFHGQINLQGPELQTPHIHPSIVTGNLNNIDNLAYIGLSPAGIANFGSLTELYTYTFFLNSELRTGIEKIIKKQLKEELQNIENKANETIGENISTKKSKIEKTHRRASVQTPASLPPARETFISRVCNFCFKLVSRDSLERLMSAVRSGMGSIENYTPKGLFKVCKTLLSAEFQFGGKKRKRNPSKISVDESDDEEGSSSGPLCSISSDICVLLLDELRHAIKSFDKSRILNLYSTATGLLTRAHDITIHNIDHRCRKLSILKGFGSRENNRYVNKYIKYNHHEDNMYNMGVSVLSFKADKSGNVVCKTPQRIDPLEIMKAITVPQGMVVDPTDPTNEEKISYWSTMESCIEYCTRGSDPNQTIVVVDLSCSGTPGDTLETPFDSVAIGLPGGSKNRKSTYKKSTTKKIKKRSGNLKSGNVKSGNVKSGNVKYKRNRKNIKSKTNMKSKTKKIK